MRNLFARLFRRPSTYEKKWWQGYTYFPPGVYDLSIVVGSDRIVNINYVTRQITVYENNQYLYSLENARLFTVQL